jgi:alpha-ketoglutarate-dependent taurine dioxygenase
MTISFVPLVLPPSADNSRFKDFGKEVKGAHPGNLTPDEFKEIERVLYQVKTFLPSHSCFKLTLYQHDLLVFRNVDLSPQQQYELVKVCLKLLTRTGKE